MDTGSLGLVSHYLLLNLRSLAEYSGLDFTVSRSSKKLSNESVFILIINLYGESSNPKDPLTPNDLMELMEPTTSQLDLLVDMCHQHHVHILVSVL